MSRDGSVSAVKTRARCYCRPLLSNPLLQFPQWKLHLSVRLTAPCLGLLQFIIYAQARYAPKKMIQHAGSCVTCRVFTSGTWILQVRGDGGGRVLGAGARQQRRSLVHAVGGHVVNRERGGGEAPGCTESSLSSEEQPAAGCWCRVAPGPAAPVTEARRRRSSAVVPAPSLTWPGAVLWIRAELNTAHIGNTVMEFCMKKTCLEIKLNCVARRITWILCHIFITIKMSCLDSKQADDIFSVLEKHSGKSIKLRFPVFATRCHCKITD